MGLRYTGEWEGVAWAVWEIEESETELWKIAGLSTSEIAKIRSITHPRRRLESLAARAARHHLPPLAHFSLSHSYPFAAAAVAPFPIGIDLERLRPFPPHVWSYFTQDIEKQMIKTSDLTEWHFWCAKELSYKLLCSKYDKISFRRELRLVGTHVQFERGTQLHLIKVHFIQTEAWMLGLGRFEGECVV